MPHATEQLGALLDRATYAGDDARAAESIRGRRVVITGAAGSIGRAVTHRVTALAPASVLLIDRRADALASLVETLDPTAPVESSVIDVCDEATITTRIAAHRSDLVIHAAALKHVPELESRPGDAFRVNVLGTRAVAAACGAAGVDQLLLVSTDKAARPRSVMGATKRLAERLVQDLEGRGPLRTRVVRFGNVLGSSGSVLEVWAAQLAAGEPMTITDPRMTRYFMTIEEAAALLVEAAGLPDTGPPGDACVELLDMGEPVGIVELARRVARRHGVEPVAADAPDRPGTVRLVVTGRRPGEKLHEDLAGPGETPRPCPHPRIQRRGGPRQANGAVERAIADLRGRLDGPPETLAAALLAAAAGGDRRDREAGAIEPTDHRTVHNPSDPDRPACRSGGAAGS